MTLETFLQAHSKQALIFDFDNTLFHLELPWEIYENRLLEILGEFDHEMLVRSAPNLGFANNLLDIYIQKYGAPLRDKVNAWAAEFERNNLQGVVENTGLIKFIEQHRDQYQLFVWTSNMAATIKPILQKRGIEELFTKIVTRDDVQLLKPYIDGFQLISADNPLKKPDYLHIGDSDDDKQAAATAGIDFYRVTEFET